MVNRIWPTAVTGEAVKELTLSASACHIDGPNWLYVVCSIFQVKSVLKMVVIVCSTLVIVCSTGRLNFVLQKMYRFSLFYKKWQV